MENRDRTILTTTDSLQFPPEEITDTTVLLISGRHWPLAAQRLAKTQKHAGIHRSPSAPRPPNRGNLLPDYRSACGRVLLSESASVFGGGQEVARWFFSVGGAAVTIAETISAYDMR